VVIVDTTVWIDYLGGVANPETDWLHAALDRERLAVTDLIDYLIATFCLREHHSLLHRDRDFDPFETLLDLSVIHP
jgi:predicted nucleic acid-binding protein